MAGACVGTGLLIALALPPWGWWPLAPIGVALFDRLIADQPARRRYWRAWGVAAGWFYPGMAWMVWLSSPGWLVASAVYATYIGAAAALSPPGPWRRVALPGAIVVAEAIRWSFPFGGVPLASFAIAEAGGPLAPIVRVGGALLLVGVVVVLGGALSALSQRAWRAGAIGLAVVVGFVAVAAVSPRGHQIGTLRVAAVQGGGPQGTRAVDTNPRLVFDRQMAATALVTQPVDVVLWPEDVVDTNGAFATSPEASELADLARRLHAGVLAVGIVDDVNDTRFVNAQVAYDTTGQIVDRYEKVHRVPFGEYMPLRGLLHALGAPTELVPRDAISGTGPAILDTPVGRLGVVISWEVFFGDRARDAISHGGTVLLNPTNGSSYRGTELQSQQIASSRLRALETDRWVVQAAPTGFSAIITPDGRVVRRSGVSEQRVVQGTVGTRAGQTLYVRFGDRPVLVVAVAAVAAAWIASTRRRRSVLTRSEAMSSR